MEILGIGPSELVFIVILALIVLGPRDMQKAGKTIGKFLRKIVTSDGWKIFQQTSRELRTLPNRLMREANEEVNKIGSEIDLTESSTLPPRNRYNTPNRMKNPNTPARSQPIPATLPEDKAVPPVVETTPNESDQQKDA